MPIRMERQDSRSSQLSGSVNVEGNGMTMMGAADITDRDWREKQGGGSAPHSAPGQTPQRVTPRPPRVRRLERAFSLDEHSWRRNLRGKQGSLADPNESGSSTGSLQEATEDPQPAMVSRFPQISHLSNSHTACLTHTKPPQLLPQVETLRTTNGMEADYRDYTQQLLHHSSHSLNRAACDSMRSTYSLLTPLRSKDVRSRSYLEGSLLASGALLGAEELDRYFPERLLRVFIATWNMQGRKVRLVPPGTALPRCALYLPALSWGLYKYLLS
ncbi:hypothetical protein GDO81_028200, partial [Engystomops pustulosus]